MKIHYETPVQRRFEADGESYVYSARSAAILRLDSVSAAILDHFGEKGGADLSEWEASRPAEESASQREVFEQLVAMGLLRPVGETAHKGPSLPPMPFPLQTLVLNVTNKCNLACTYCYEYGDDRIADEKKDGREREPRMSTETACQSVDFLFARSPGRGEVTITFFGGETLLNFSAVRAATEHALALAQESGRRVSFSLTTNATLLTDEVIDFLVRHQFGINVSIDGNRADQDRHRTFQSGKGSYDRIAPRIRKLIERNRAARGRPIGARVTLTRGMAPVGETFRHLTEELGFDAVGFAPVTSASDRDYALDDGHLGTILAEFSTLAEDYVETAMEGRRHGFSNLHDLMTELHRGTDKAHPCGAGLGLLGVSTEGDLGLCHRFVESGEHEVGSIHEGIDEAKRSDFLTRGHISNKVACHQCFARPHCSGGCYHEAYVRYRDPSQPNLHYCEWIRAWTDLGLQSYARITQRRPDYFDQFDTVAPAQSSASDRQKEGSTSP